MSGTPVGKTSAPLNSYFALVADDPSVQIVSKAQTWYIGQMLKARSYGDLPVLSAAAPFKCGGRAGRTTTPTSRPAPSPSRTSPTSTSTRTPCSAVAITGAQVKEWLEMSAGIFNRIEKGKADQQR